MKKILVSDYDKTYYRDDNSIKTNNEYIKDFRNNNNIFIIATGRSYYDFKMVKDLYRIEYDYLFINHGATILDNNNNILYNFSITDTTIKDIKNILELENSINNFYCSCLESRVPNTHKDITKINITYKDDNTAKKITNLVNSNYSKSLKAYHISKNKIEIVSSKASKLNSINLLLECNNWDKKSIYTIGDGYSDIEMIKEFKGFNIKNSIEELKSISINEYNNVSDLVKDIMANKI